MSAPKNADVNANMLGSKPPKRAVSAFLFFSTARRPDIKKEQPELSVTQVAKLLGQEWASMSQEEKGPFQAQADTDKKRYAKEKADYVPEEGGPQKANRKRKRTAEKAKEGVKKPLTAYFHYLAAQRDKMRLANPDLSQKELLREMGRLWREMGQKEKEVFVKRADEDKARYEKEKKATVESESKTAKRDQNETDDVEHTTVSEEED